MNFSSLTEKSKYIFTPNFRKKKLQTIYENAKTSSSSRYLNTHASFEFRKSLQYYNKYVMNKNINVYFTEVLKLVCACGILQFPCIIKIILMTQYVVFNINYKEYIVHGQQYVSRIVSHLQIRLCAIIPIYAYISQFS